MSNLGTSAILAGASVFQYHYLMKIALLSDTHNAVFNIQTALQKMQQENVKTLIHCGDMTHAETAELFQPFCIHHVWGNGDIDTIGLQIVIFGCQPGSSSTEIFTSVMDGKRIAALHGHQVGMIQTMANSGHYDYIFYGHTHQMRDEKRGNTRMINPGAIGGAYRGTRGFCFIDITTGDLTVVPLER